jgi:hypothetical protein
LFTSDRCRTGPAPRFRLAAAASLLLALAFPGSSGAAEDYEVVFGDKLREAERFFRQNGWMAAALGLDPADTRIALAVVFPEVIRFRSLEDRIQIRVLKVLYVQYGRAYLDFSVGPFQMKPSFAESLESDCARLFSAGERKAAAVPDFAAEDSPEARRQRILRLDDLAWQVRYLRLFMLVMNKRYARAKFGGDEDRLRFYATAYNAGYAAGETVLRRVMGRRRFHVELLFPKALYDYAEVALFFYRRAFLGGHKTLSPS